LVLVKPGFSRSVETERARAFLRRTPHCREARRPSEGFSVSHDPNLESRVDSSPLGGDGKIPLLGCFSTPTSPAWDSRSRMVRKTRILASQDSCSYDVPRRDAAAFKNQGAFHRGDPSGLRQKMPGGSLPFTRPRRPFESTFGSGLCDEKRRRFFDRASLSGRTSTSLRRRRCLVWTTKHAGSDVG